jgi:hypothetical protein
MIRSFSDTGIRRQVETASLCKFLQLILIHICHEKPFPQQPNQINRNPFHPHHPEMDGGKRTVRRLVS